MIEIKINNDIVEILKQEGFYPDTMLAQYMILQCLKNGDTQTLELFDDSYKSKRFVLQYYELIRKGLIEETPDRKSFAITDRGIKFLGKLAEFMKHPKEEKEGEVDDWIDEWVELFPKGVKTGGKLVRSDRKSCLIKMRKFVKTYKYDKDTIIKATLAYLSEREREGWKYTKCATYFIDKKGEGSDLAGWCEEAASDDYLNNYESTNTGLIN